MTILELFNKKFKAKGDNMDKKIVLITGAGKGIGKATVKKFLKEGFIVVATDKVWENKIENNFVYCYEMDVTDRNSIKYVVNKIEKEIGSIDVLVNAAGIFETLSVGQTSVVQWENIFSVNSTGVFNVTQIITDKMQKRKKGSVVIVSSNSSKFPRKYMAAYAASKAAASMYIKCLALELSEYNIRCNIVSPGSTNTDMQRKLWNGAEIVPKAVLEGDLKNYRLGIPLRKIAEPNEIADAIYFLASDAAGHITMEELTVDGGATMGV